MHYNGKMRTFLLAGLGSGFEAQNALCLRVLTKLVQCGMPRPNASVYFNV